jgi:Rod binding domain-containing protein
VTQRAATAKLDALKGSDADFAATMAAEAGKAAASDSPTMADVLSGATSAQPVQVIKAAAPGDVYRKFEAFMLQTFVEAMLPKDSEQLFGKGTAGSVWKSMLAEQLGNQLAANKGIGIAKQLAAAHPPPRDAGGKAG